MKVRQSLIACGMVIVACLLINLLLDSRTSGQQAATPPAAAGRYQIVVKANGNNSVVFVFDPVTADCWYGETIHSAKEWTHMGSPVVKARP